MTDHDVVIVGAGPAGLLLGCLLAQAGRDIAVIEQRRTVDGRSRAIGIHPPGQAALAEAGLVRSFRAEALTLSGGTVSARGRTTADLAFPAGREVLTIPQERTEALLIERLGALAPDTLRMGAPVVVVGARDDHVGVRIAGEAGIRTARTVVVADGVRSGIRRALAIPWRRVPGAGEYAMLDVSDPDPDRRAHLHLEPAGVVESFPLPGDRRRWVLREDGRRSRTVVSFAQEVHTRIGVEIGDAGETAPQSFRASQHRAGHLVHGRIVLLGDAAHEVSPIGGQGMNLAWIGACRLAVALTRRADQQAALRAYERAMLRSARTAQGRARFNMAMGARLPLPVYAARDAAIGMLAEGASGRRLLARMTMEGL